MCFTQHGIVASIGAILTDIITQQTLIESGDPQVQFVILDDGGVTALTGRPAELEIGTG